MTSVCLGTALSRSLVISLAVDCGTASELARFIAERPGGTFDIASVTFASRSALARVATDFVRRSWLSTVPGGWCVGPLTVPPGVVLFLEGAAAMRANDPDKETAVAVVTMPPPPSAIAAALPQTGPAHASLVSTRDALESVAERAVDGFTVMTPFLNKDGLWFVLKLFDITRATNRRLIVRQMGEARRTVIDNASEIAVSGMQKIVQRMRKELALPAYFTLDACRHGGLTELEEAELTDGQGRALSAHRTQESYEGYAKRNLPRALSATRKRYAHVAGERIRNKASE